MIKLRVFLQAAVTFLSWANLLRWLTECKTHWILSATTLKFHNYHHDNMTFFNGMFFCLAIEFSLICNLRFKFCRVTFDCCILYHFGIPQPSLFFKRIYYRIFFDFLFGWHKVLAQWNNSWQKNTRSLDIFNTDSSF